MNSADNPQEVYCPECLKRITWALPVVPLYSLDHAMTYLMVASRAALYQLLYRHKALIDPPRYAYGEHGRRYRLLSATDIRLLQRKMRIKHSSVIAWMLRLGELSRR